MTRRGEDSRGWPFPLLVILFFILATPTLSADVLRQLSVDPATVRQKEADETSIVGTVILKAPSSKYFICEVSSNDNDKVTIQNIIFKKNQLKGTVSGVIHWLHIQQDCKVKISAFDVDIPGDKFTFTLTLKTRDNPETVEELQP